MKHDECSRCILHSDIYRHFPHFLIVPVQWCSTLCKILSSRLIIKIYFCPICKNGNQFGGQCYNGGTKHKCMMTVSGRKIDKSPIFKLFEVQWSFFLSPFTLEEYRAVATLWLCISCVSHFFLCTALLFFITFEASSQIIQVPFGLSRLCLMRFMQGGWKRDFQRLQIPVRALYWSRQRGCWGCIWTFTNTFKYSIWPWEA